MAVENLTGRYHVRAIWPAFDDLSRIMKKTKERIEVRRHALKLRFWPRSQNNELENGQLVDLDWSWIRALPGLRIGELRIQDSIGGNNNLRIIFFEGEHVNENVMPI